MMMSYSRNIHDIHKQHALFFLGSAGSVLFCSLFPLPLTLPLPLFFHWSFSLCSQAAHVAALLVDFFVWNYRERANTFPRSHGLKASELNYSQGERGTEKHADKQNRTKTETRSVWQKQRKWEQKRGEESDQQVRLGESFPASEWVEAMCNLLGCSSTSCIVAAQAPGVRRCVAMEWEDFQRVSTITNLFVKRRGEAGG